MKVTIKLVDNQKGVSWLPIREANWGMFSQESNSSNKINAIGTF